MNDYLDAMVLAAREAYVSRSYPVAELPRLAEQSIGADSRASLEARFHLVDGRCAIAGRVEATLRVTCQRCLRPTDLDIDDEFHVVLVGSEAEMNALPEMQDSAIANATHLDLAWLAEEQLLLALPLVTLHEPAEECVMEVGDDPPPHETTHESETHRPFANLRDLLKK